MRESNHNTTTMNAAAIETLSQRLATEGPVTLDNAERALMIDALRQLGADQIAMLRLRRLLSLHDESSERLERIAAKALGEIRRRMDEPAPDETYDHAAAESARERLAEKLHAAADGRETIGAILSFVRDVVVILR